MSHASSSRDYLGRDVPYLFKVLSVGKALSMQAHPDQGLAEKLHAARPAIYTDPNHKPEMAVAITPFEAMCGFRPPAEIAEHLRTVPGPTLCARTFLDSPSGTRILFFFLQSYEPPSATTSRPASSAPCSLLPASSLNCCEPCSHAS